MTLNNASQRPLSNSKSYKQITISTKGVDPFTFISTLHKRERVHRRIALSVIVEVHDTNNQPTQCLRTMGYQDHQPLLDKSGKQIGYILYKWFGKGADRKPPYKTGMLSN